MKLPFIELTHASGDKLYLNRHHIISVYIGGGKCFIRVAHINNPIEIQESYDTVKTRLYD